MAKVDLLYNQLKSALYDIEEVYSTHEIKSVNLDVTNRVHNDSISITLDIEVIPREEEEEEEPPFNYGISKSGEGVINYKKADWEIPTTWDVLLTTAYKNKGDKKGD